MTTHETTIDTRIVSRLQQLLADQTGVAPSELTPERAWKALFADALARTAFLQIAETALGVSLDFQQAQDCSTIQDLVSLIGAIPMTKMLVYCMNCKGKRRVKDPQRTTTRNGKPMLRALCATCGGNVTRLLSAKASQQ